MMADLDLLLGIFLGLAAIGMAKAIFDMTKFDMYDKELKHMRNSLVRDLKDAYNHIRILEEELKYEKEQNREAKK